MDLNKFLSNLKSGLKLDVQSPLLCKNVAVIDIKWYLYIVHPFLIIFTAP